MFHVVWEDIISSALTVGDFHRLLKDLAKGLEQAPPNITSIPLLGTTFTVQDLKLTLVNYEVIYANVDKASVTLAQAVNARNAIEPHVRELVSALKRSLKAALGKKAPELQNFGFAPDKLPEPPTVEEKLARIAKNKATRVARHTKGLKQKAKIKGQVSSLDAPVPPNGSGPVTA